ncbi:MAG: hypothetical protein NC399_08665 [Muribaculum sp.]|nr:hypothetical protein [Muribaculum sp.]
MDQIHISEERQEEIIRNVLKRMNETAESGKRGNRRKRELRRNAAGIWGEPKGVGEKRRRAATAAAAFVLLACVVSIPVRAVVINAVKERMERIPKEEVREMNDMVQAKPTEADVFSREYSDDEEERSRELWKAYKKGKFPQNVLVQVDNAEDVPEGTLCYIRSTGVFQLPDQEMTDEEILEIIDFQHKMSYAVSQGSAAQEAREEMLAEQEKLRERVAALGGISQYEAEKIAVNQMKTELGDDAEDTEFQWITLEENGEAADGGLVYDAFFHNSEARFWYECVIDAVGGEIRWTEVF